MEQDKANNEEFKKLTNKSDNQYKGKNKIKCKVK